MSKIKLYRTLAQTMLAIGFAAGLASIAAAAQINPGGSSTPPPPPPPSKKPKGKGCSPDCVPLGVRGHKPDHDETTRGLKSKKKAEKSASMAPAESSPKAK